MPAYKDEGNGTWYCKFYYKNFMGVQKQKWKRGFSTKKEAQIFERDFLQKQQTMPDITFGNLYQSYMEEMAVRLKQSTIIIKENICETKILPYFRDKPINEICAIDIRRWQNALLESGHHYSATYLKTINNQMTAIMNYAKKYYNLRINPCEQAGSIGTSRAERMQYWTLEEYLMFREGIRNKKSSFMCFEILYWTGMREGEMLALTAGDIDFDRKEIRIDKTYQRLEGRDVISTPKTKKSKRKVMIPDFLCEELREYMKSRMTKESREGERLFPFTRFFLNYEMKRGCKKTGVKKIRVHDIRHSHVSLLINQGFDALVIADRVGHENVSTTLNTYSHLFPNRQAVLVSSLERLAQIQVEDKNSKKIKNQ